MHHKKIAKKYSALRERHTMYSACQTKTDEFIIRTISEMETIHILTK